ncbi:Fatty acid hydroxylase [Pyrenophora seminiperda CCB06]|uniref:Fatty acid hydroxylase n=1 Tax=Pyrenophora seminiperda CCB06 TaxID=1302712 RepID=A0A3M7M7K5_9PLEO|nr:Fatty acid hydroxylase [Pyrenophora seminiperda CCB06]
MCAVYYAAHRSVEDHIILEWYSALVGTTRAQALMDLESTFDILYSRVGRDWQQRDDTVTPFNDRRWTHVRSVWTFDPDGDILRLDKIDCNLLLPLTLFRQRSITISDFKPYELSPTLVKHALPHKYSGWTMRRPHIDLQHLQRRKIFVSRILADFAFQCRHVLCGHYNNSTFRRLACAIVQIVTHDFSVEEATLSRQGMGGSLVSVVDLPKWDFANGHIVRVGGVSIVICQHTPHAIPLVQDDFGKHILSTTASADDTYTYLILTVREVIVYRINSKIARYTKPSRLFNGTDPPSDEAIELLLQATQIRPPTAPLRKLPIELQDMILEKISAGPIERARFGCLLDAGSVFTWKCGNRNIEREEGRRFRTPWTPVESHIWFGGYPSGIAYK